MHELQEPRKAPVPSKKLDSPILEHQPSRNYDESSPIPDIDDNDDSDDHVLNEQDPAKPWQQRAMLCRMSKRAVRSVCVVPKELETQKRTEKLLGELNRQPARSSAGGVEQIENWLVG